MLSRRRFLPLLAAAPTVSLGDVAPVAGRRIDLRIGEGFGTAREADIRAVLLSAASTIWPHCPETRWEQPGFFVFHSETAPITQFDLRGDGRIAIGLTSQGTHWAQFAFQFAHEFCHALALHTNDAKTIWGRGLKPNHWLEESLCETASLFALRAMSESWKIAPPFPNWKSYGISLAQYAADRMQTATDTLAGDRPFKEWFGENEASLRALSTQREKNNVVALQLLPLFEAEPGGWESITFFNRGKRDPQETLATHFSEWAAAAPVLQRGFIDKAASVFGLAASVL